MKFNVDANLWKRFNFLAKGCMIVGVWLVTLAMRLGGLEEKDTP